MAALSEIIDVAREAAKRSLKPTDVIDVQVEPGVGSDGESILRITIVVPDNQFNTIDGDHFLSTVSEIGESLGQIGDERFAVVTYVTPSEMSSIADHQS
jgi:hypothetical protein